jgi:hemolysin activation/secretion protein
MRIASRYVAAALAAVLLPASARAQVDAGAEAFRRQEQREAIERERIAPQPEVALPRPDVPSPEALPDERPCFRIDRIALTGAEGRLAWLGREAARYAGRCLGVRGVNAVAGALQAALIGRGLVTTRIAVPEQDLSGGTLELAVIPGRVGEVRFAEPQSHATLANAFTMPEGALLDLRDLEQGLEQMKRLPSQDVEIDIVPGTEPGVSDVVVRRAAGRPVRGIVAVDDAGQKATGKYQASATLAIDGPLGLNDLFYVSHNQALDRGGGTRDSRGTNGYYSIPYGWWTVAFGAADFDFRQTIQGVAQTFVNSGETQTLDLRIARIVQRTQVSRTGVQFRVQRRRSSAFVEDVEIVAQRRRVSAAELSLQHRHRVADALVDVSVAYRQGVPWFDAEDPAPDAGPDTPDPRYRLATLELLVAVPFEVAMLPLRYQGVVRAQYTNDALFAQDFFAIGSRYTVRGFDGERTLAADRGWLIRNELATPIPIPGHEVYAGIDHGEVGGPFSRVLAGTRLTGAVAGLRGGFRGLLYEGFVGWALAKPEGYTSKSPTLGFQVLYSF